MEVDEEEERRNDPNYETKKDPLALFPDKRKDKPLKRSSKNQYSSSEQQLENNVDKKYGCTCGKNFVKLKSRTAHISQNRKKGLGGCEAIGRVINMNLQMCDLCGERFSQTDILEHLTNSHLNGNEEWVMRCPNEKCGYRCINSKAFNVHVHKIKTDECSKIWRKNYGPICEICGFKGTNMLKLKNHVKDSHENGEEKKWKCPISGCGKRFCVRQSVRDHLSEHRYRPKITKQDCDKCGGKFKVEEMEGHLKGEHGVEEVIGCGQCQMRFSGREEMVEHLYEHRGTGIFCDICGVDEKVKFVSRYSDFREHYFGVHKLCPKRYKCGEGGCDLWFWRKGIMNDHVNRMHKESNERLRYQKQRERKKMQKFKCDLCDEKFVTEISLTSHKIRVHGADPFKCEVCGETFNVRWKFNKHRKEHVGIWVQKEWRCEVEGCGKIFKKKHYWKHHVEVGHEGKRRHVCEICGKGFTFAQGLRGHRDSVHLGLKPWVCEDCGERFGSGTTLRKHKLIHTGERPFGCEVCGQRFRHKGVLKTHLKGHEEKGAGFKPNGPMKQIRKRKAE